ncbi:hypothetical protein A3I34_01340 [Candidatus Jorgensenbacteria bacterium RIFCSPLOWO2_02_FULL_45_12]|nr:MAG: hypothetical protein A3I34_01340 [Candidatus Jorgensenbacteria bacterium RIFCSPLOWO2_02_FULL_45_12]
MKIAIAVPGRFHLFYLAQQLLKRGYLSQLITSYPKFEVRKYGIPDDKMSTVVAKELIQRGWAFLPRFLQNLYNPQYAIHGLFDTISSLKLEPSDLFIGMLAAYPKTMKKAKKMGARVIIENGSSHTLYAVNILKEEYDKFGAKYEPFQISHEKLIKHNVSAYEDADYISVPSLFAKRTFLEYGVPEDKIIHVPYGVELSQFRQIPKKDNIFRVIFVGGMTLQKGVHYLIRAFAELNLPDSELVLVGTMSAEMEPFFKKYDGKFRYAGHVPQGELFRYYSRSSVFAIMSIQEGLALVTPQAMACGLPVVATTNTGAEDIVRDGKDGFIIPIRDCNALKEKLLYFYMNPEARDFIGKSAKERVSQGFTWDDYGEHIIAEYERIYKK